MIIAVPAFLKRTVEDETESFGLKSPVIFTSGGVLTPDVAKKTDQIMGFWPIEVYGSTETSGIAYRQSKNGLEWTPFDNAEISQNADGCHQSGNLNLIGKILKLIQEKSKQIFYVCRSK